MSLYNEWEMGKEDIEDNIDKSKINIYVRLIIKIYIYLDYIIYF